VIIVIIVVASFSFWESASSGGRRGRARVAIPAPARAAMPTVLVTELPSVRHWKPRHSPSASVITQRLDRVRSLSSVGH